METITINTEAVNGSSVTRAFLEEYTVQSGGIRAFVCLFETQTHLDDNKCAEERSVDLDKVGYDGTSAWVAAQLQSELTD